MKRIGWISLLFLSLIIVVFLLRFLLEERTAPNTPYRIARDASFTPLNLMDKQKNMLAFSDDLLAAIAQEEGMAMEISSATSQTMWLRLDSNEYDGVLASLPLTPFNRAKYEFSESYFYTGAVLVVRANSTIKGPEDLRNKAISVPRSASISLQTDILPSVIIVPYDSVLTALESLLQERVDAVILEVFPAHAYIQSFFQGKLKLLPKPLMPNGLHLITSKTARGKELVARFNKGLEAMKKNGTYAKLIDKWGIKNEAQ